MARTILQVSEVTASHGDFSIGGADFFLQSGDIMGLVGKSGSGKSTLIDAILGLKEPDSGNIWAEIRGEEREIKKISGHSPQDNSLHPFLSIQENLNSFGKLRGVKAGQIEKRSEKILKELQIYEHRRKKVSNLSGGMRKRADLAVSLLHDPQILVLDEPFAGIDPPQREIIWDNLWENAERGKIIILTSHLLSELEEKCNKYGLIHKGEFYRSAKITEMMEDTDYQNIENFLNDVFRF